MYEDNMITFMEAMLYANEGKSPSKAIENQEKRGQADVIRNQRLPKMINDTSLSHDIYWKGVTDDMDYEERRGIVTRNRIEYTKLQYEKMGIKIIDGCDDLFWNVTLPDGWQIKATEHSMWSNLYDDKGRKRANFFYKAAFYDRDAFINFCTRFAVVVEHTAPDDAEYEIWQASDYQGKVKDGDEIIYCTECISPVGTYSGDDIIKTQLREKLINFMNEHYPNYKDINAYWD